MIARVWLILPISVFFGALRNHFGGCAGSEGSTLRGVFFQKDRVYR